MSSWLSSDQPEPRASSIARFGWGHAREVLPAKTFFGARGPKCPPTEISLPKRNETKFREIGA